MSIMSVACWPMNGESCHGNGETRHDFVSSRHDLSIQFPSMVGLTPSMAGLTNAMAGPTVTKHCRYEEAQAQRFGPPGRPRLFALARFLCLLSEEEHHEAGPGIH